MESHVKHSNLNCIKKWVREHLENSLCLIFDPVIGYIFFKKEKHTLLNCFLSYLTKTFMKYQA